MASEDLENRLAIVEAEVARLKQAVEQISTTDAKLWLEVVFGAFKDDPLFDEAERHGREWRTSQQSEDENTHVSA